MATDHQVATAIGINENTHTWLYLEIAQMGSNATITRGLNCGSNATGAAANTSFPSTYPAMLTYDVQTGRTATSVATSSGCSVSFEKHYTVIGASVPYYNDPSQELPSADQKATGSSPGWQDWDHDGYPGYTVHVTGNLVTGSVYLATRTVTQWSGTIAKSSSTFRLTDTWSTTQSVLGETSSILSAATSATPDTDTSVNFVQFARLGAAQAMGDDAAACAAVRSLAATLTPDAAKD